MKFRVYNFSFGVLIFFVFSFQKISAKGNIELEELRMIYPTSTISLVEESTACSIYKIENEDGTVFFNVVAAIATTLLPEIIEGFCERTIGDPDICRTVYDVTSMLVTLRGKAIYRAATVGMHNTYNWIANRGVRVSSAMIETRTYENADKVKALFNIYKDRCERGDGIAWESVSNERYAASFVATDEFFNINGDVYGRIVGTGVNVRTQPAINNYNFKFKVHNNDNVKLLGYKKSSMVHQCYIVESNTKLYTSDGGNIIIPKGGALQYIDTNFAGDYIVEFNQSDGTSIRGKILKNSMIRKMDDQLWYKIEYQGRIGWVFEDFVRN